MKTYQPVIKWSGSKRSQAKQIILHFPKEIRVYYEPFCGGASVFRALFEDESHNVERYVISDLNEDLIMVLEFVRNKPDITAMYYESMWRYMNEYNCETQAEKQDYYNQVRGLFNVRKHPFHFLFLNRTCFNGLIRYNSKGEFNTPFHLNRDGIHPDKMRKIIYEWSDVLNAPNVEIRHCSYEKIKPENGDFVYIDPPYNGTKGIYDKTFDNQPLFEWMRGLKCGFCLSYDGKSGEKDHTYQVPFDLYDEHFYLESGNSSFKRLKTNNKKANVFESLYVKRQT